MSGPNFFSAKDVHMHAGLPVWIEKSFQTHRVNFHTHEFIEVAFVAGGSTVLEHTDLHNEKRVLGLVQGDLFSVQEHEWHSYAKGENLILYNIYLLPEFVSSYKHLSAVSGWHLLFGQREKSETLVLHLSPAEREHATAILDQAVYESRTQTPGFEVMLTTLILNFLIESCRTVDQKRSSIPAAETGILRSIRVIEENSIRAFQLKELAAIANMSVSSYTAKFRSATGLSPMEYIRKLRLKQVCYYLETTDKTIGEIAQLCGFCTPNYLTELFHREFGETPQIYRQSRTRLAFFTAGEPARETGE